MVGMPIFFGIFYLSWYKLERKLFLGIFEVAEHEYDIGFTPGNTWCPGRWVCASSSGGFIHLGINWSENYFWDFLRSPNMNMTSGSVPELPGAQDGGYAHLLREIYSSWYKLEQKLFLGVFEVAER